MQKITPFLWFEENAEEAVNFYVSVFRNSRIDHVVRYGEADAEVSGQPKGSVQTVSFQIEGQQFMALNGGPHFKFTGAISFLINCETQDEVDYYWTKLSAGGDESAQQCGWLKDRYGVTWQVVPRVLDELLSDPDPQRSQRTMRAMLKMKKLDIAGLKRAYDGQANL